MGLLLVVVILLVASVITLEVEFRLLDLSRAELNIVAPKKLSVFPMTSQIVSANRPRNDQEESTKFNLTF